MPGVLTDAVGNQSRTDMREDDKSENGNRYDTIPLANGLIKAGAQCDIVKYDPEDLDTFKQQCQATAFPKPFFAYISLGRMIATPSESNEQQMNSLSMCASLTLTPTKHLLELRRDFFAL